MRGLIEFCQIIAQILCFVLGIVVVIGGLAAAGGYYQGCQEARVFNQMHNSQWTCWDFMWAGDQINKQTITLRRDQ